MIEYNKSSITVPVFMLGSLPFCKRLMEKLSERKYLKNNL